MAKALKKITYSVAVLSNILTSRHYCDEGYLPDNHPLGNLIVSHFQLHYYIIDNLTIKNELYLETKYY